MGRTKKTKATAGLERNSTLLQSGYLVVGNITRHNCVTYQAQDRTTEREDVREESEWKTHKLVQNVVEQEALTKTCSSLLGKLSRLGTHVNGFGYLVPSNRAGDLESQLREIEQEAAAYNAKATCTSLDAWFSVFEIAGNNERIARALYRKIGEALERIVDAVGKGDVKALRQALGMIRGVESMLPETSSKALTTAVTQAREAAKAAVKASKKITDDEEAVGVRKSILKAVPINPLRSSVVEIVTEIESTGPSVYIDPVGPRAIE